MNDTQISDPLSDRIERLLLRHEESRHTIELLKQQVRELTSERDSLQSRLQAASQRIEAVLERLPTATQEDILEDDAE